MNKKQWYASAVLFLIFTLIATYFQMTYTRLVSASTVDFMFLTARMYEILQIIFVLGFLICAVCGYLEKTKG
ncbi:MAG TPA: hypothetical protein VJH04_02745 [archaeon]|nr:hypothetical protein [archaeon]